MKDKAVQVDFAKMEKLIKPARPMTINGNFRYCTHLGCELGLGLHKCPDRIRTESKRRRFAAMYGGSPSLTLNKVRGKS